MKESEMRKNSVAFSGTEPSVELSKRGPGETAVSALQTHISVCLCTFKRPELLGTLLKGLLRQQTDEQFTYSIIVVDNDRQESGRPTVERFQRNSPRNIQYFVETEQSIALARNRAVANATGVLVAFIDDDEVPIDDWLLRMHAALGKFKADGVLGPVKPRFAVTPPEWALRSGAFDRPNSQNYKSGLVLHWSQTGTGNALLRRSVLQEAEGPFRKQFGSGGEDIDFFRRAMALGKVFVWCDEGTVYETVPAERTRISFQLKRALLRGKVSLAGPAGGALGILKSMAACAIYTVLLPVFLPLGRHVFLKYLIKNCDHIGKLLAVCKINVVREKYVLK
jgi:glycosyltransferase involved in cell wall biosynthesis